MELHIASWNCERLAPYISPKPTQLGLNALAPRPASTLADVFASLQSPHIVCMQEIRLRPRDDVLVALAARAVPGYQGHFNLCDDAYNAKATGGRLYGVATYVHTLAPRPSLQTLPWDTEGRILIADFPALNLSVVNWYGVNGTARPYYADGQQSGDRYAFKLRSQQALMQACASLKGRRLVVIGDVNVTPTALDITPRLRTSAPHVAARAFMLEEFIPQLDLVDVWRRTHPKQRAYTWFNRTAPPGHLDAARVDYALVSRDLVDNVTDVRIDAAPAARFASDHAPIHVTLSL